MPTTLLRQTDETNAAGAPPVVSRPPASRWTGPLLILLAAALVAWRWHTRSHFLIDWDAVNYALALDHYDIHLGQPHPPGYFVYILLGRAVRCFVPETNTALVLLSALFGAFLVALLWRLGREMYGSPVGVLAAALGLTGPLFWYQSSVASSRTAEGFFAIAIAYLCFQVRRRNSAWAFWLLPLTLALAGGVRQNILLFLLPLCVYATWEMPPGRRLAAGALLTIGVLAWAVPMLAITGGIAEYERLNAIHWQTFVTHESGVFDAPTLAQAARRLALNNGSLLVYLFFICVLGLPVCLLAAHRARARHRIRWSEDVVFWSLAAGPALLFFAFLHLRHFGHTMAFAPFFALLTAVALRFLAPAPRAFAGLGVVLVAANLAATLWYPPHLLEKHIGTPTISAIRESDRFLDETLRAIQTNTDPRDTVVIASEREDRYFDFYLPSYTRFWIPQHPQPVEILGSRRMSLAEPAPAAIILPGRARRFVFVGGDRPIPAMLARRSDVTYRPLSSDAPWLLLAETRVPARLRLTGKTLVLDPVSGPAGRP